MKQFIDAAKKLEKRGCRAITSSCGYSANYLPEIAAEVIIDGMERNKFQVFIGKDANMMNVLYRINPRWATRFMAKQMKALLPE